MRKIWWPEPLYQTRPWGVMALGAGAGLLVLARSLALGDWDALFAGGFVLACAVIVHAGVVLQMRLEYRSKPRQA